MATNKTVETKATQAEQAQATETKEEQVETPETQQATVVDLTANEKKGGFFRDMSIGMKIGMGVVFSGLAIGAGYLIKKVFFGGNDDEPIEVEGTVTDSVGPTDE